MFSKKIAADKKDNKKYKTMSELHNPYGDGMACGRIIKFMKEL